MCGGGGGSVPDPPPPPAPVRPVIVGRASALTQVKGKKKYGTAALQIPLMSSLLLKSGLGIPTSDAQTGT
jgi:hypothetical protein